MNALSTLLRRGAAYAALASLAVACGGSDEEAIVQQHNTLTAAEREAGWILLFDGSTTDGWRAYNGERFPEAGWEVAEDCLIVLGSDGSEEGLGGDIITEEAYDNFELTLEFKLSPIANSGIFYRAVESPGEAIWHNAPEYQVLDDTAYIEMGTMDMHTHLTGDNYDLHASRVTASNPIGEWNHARIVVDGAHVEHWLNGHLTVEYELWTPEWEQLVQASKFADYPGYGRAASGHIGLQDHGHTLRYRNIKLRPIEQ
jgi:hypothetical protein